MGLAQRPAQIAGWGPVIADVARQIVEQQKAPWRFSVTDELGRVIGNVNTRRRPTADHAAFIRARDRRCRFPGCRAPAWRCELDHTDDVAHGGETTDLNIGCLCKRHHLLKHAEIGWELIQLPDGLFLWRSPLGRCYAVTPDTVDDDF
jgi:hypothetical protein